MKGFLIGFGVVACLAVTGGVALAGLENVKTEVLIVNAEATVYEGAVDADEPCLKSRRVHVYHDENSNDLADPEDFRIGGDKSDENGEFTVIGNQAPAGDHIIAIVESKKLKKKDVKCGRAFGDTVALNP